MNWMELLEWGAEQQADLRELGFDFIRQGHYERASLYFEALVALDNGSLYDQFTLGALYVQTGDGERALRHLDRALEIDATSVPAQVNRAHALILMGQHGDALIAARQLAQLPDPTARRIGEAIQLAYA